MPNYLVESYLANSSAAAEQASEHARSLTDERAGVRYLRTTFLPGDETIFHVFEAPSIAALRYAARCADLQCERIVDVVETPAAPGEPDTTVAGMTPPASRARTTRPGDAPNVIDDLPAPTRGMADR
jgi:hypothetical protein